MLLVIRNRIVFILIILLVGCGPQRTETPSSVPQTPDTIDEMNPSVQERDIITVELNEIRLADDTPLQVVPLDTVWMIPVGVNQEVTARMQYLEAERDVIITRETPYTPTSRWDISTDRKDLNGENFGLWFIISNTGNNSMIQREAFVQITQDAAAVLIAGGITAILTITPGPDEAVTGAVAVSRGRSIINTLRAFGTGILAERDDLLTEFTGRQVDNAFNIAEEVNKIDYFNELYVIISADEDYYLNNQVIATTADGSLEFVFSIFETSNQIGDRAEVVPDNTVEAFPPLECNPTHESMLAIGMEARVIAASINAVNRITENTAAFRLRGGDVVKVLSVSCDTTDQVLWWLVETNAGERGWVPESRGQNVFLEPDDA